MATQTPPPSLPPDNTGNNGLTEEGLRVIVVSAVLTALATLSVIARLWSRYLNSSSWTPAVEDWLVLGALLFTWGYAGGNIVFAYNGLGVRGAILIQSGRTYQLQTQLKLLIANQVTYAIALGMVKTSILLSFKRIFHIYKTFRVLANLAIAFVLCWVAATILVAFLICRPLSYNWDQVGQTGSCGNLTAAYVSIGIVDVISDIIIFVLPLPLVSKLKMRKSAKWATMSLFSLGFLTIAAGAVRTGMIFMVQFDPTDPEGPTQNLIWAAVEPCVATMVACLLVIKPLLQYAREHMFSIISSFPSTWASRNTQSRSSLWESITASETNKDSTNSDISNKRCPHLLANASQSNIWATRTMEFHVNEAQLRGQCFNERG